jgi:predicted SPOUT superfamily RNA methylase MTH1
MSELASTEGPDMRKQRKEEAKLLKRKRIEESGGVRPRVVQMANAPKGGDKKKKNKMMSSNKGSNHRFGRVMETVPCRNKPRYSTLTIAIPGSVVSNCQTRELKTHMVGQIARAATIYHVDEIVVFDDKLTVEKKSFYRGGGGNNRQHRSDHRQRDDHQNKEREQENKEQQPEENAPPRVSSRRSDPHTFMARVLQYCECPQYLRRNFFPMHPDLQFTGLLSPIDAPHHVRAEDRSPYREGVVMDRKGGSNGGSLVNCGIRNRPVEIDRVLQPGIRCTVELDPKVYGSASQIKGKVVSPSTPRETNGTYWGYTTRLAEGINAVFDGCPFDGGYDLKIGTSERGDCTVDDSKFTLPTFKHTLIVFGGVAGIEECVDADETIKIPGSQSKELFDLWVNTCPFQGSRTIRTEEAVMVSLARFSPYLAQNREKKEEQGGDGSAQNTEPVAFSDNELSDESDSDDE